MKLFNQFLIPIFVGLITVVSVACESQIADSRSDAPNARIVDPDILDGEMREDVALGVDDATEFPTFSPTTIDWRENCENDIDFLYMGIPSQDCAWVGERIRLRCRQVQPVENGGGGRSVEVFCPQQCRLGCEDVAAKMVERVERAKRKPTIDMDVATEFPTFSPTTIDWRANCVNDDSFLYQGIPSQDCAWVGERTRLRCRQIQPVENGGGGRSVEVFCPQQCRLGCENVAAKMEERAKRKPTIAPSSPSSWAPTMAPTPPLTPKKPSCQNSKEIVYVKNGNKNKYCNWVKTGKTLKIRQNRCNKKVYGGKKIRENCAKACGKYAGVSPCEHLWLNKYKKNGKYD